MRVPLKLLGLSAVAISVVAPTASIAAQGRGKGHQEERAQSPRARGQDGGRVAVRGRVDRGTAYVQGAQVRVREQPPSRPVERPRAVERPRIVEPPRVVERRADDSRWRDNGRGRPDDRWRDNGRGRPDGRRYDNGRWRPDDHWRGENVRVIRQYYAVPRHLFVPRFAYARLPYGWSSRVYLYGFFPYEYDYYVEPVPPELEYLLPPLYSGYDRFIFGGRILVVDHFSRNIVFMISL